MSDDQLNDWIEITVKNTHYSDLRYFRDFLDREISEYDSKILHNTFFKMCDQCELTYPEQTNECSHCHGHRLRAFKIHNNLEELRKNWK